MKNFVMMAAALVLGFTLQINDAEAKRIGGGGSTGMQRQSVALSNTQQAAPRQATPAAAGQAAQPKRSWMGPLAGLAAGLGLAALASHFGFGEELASFMMMALLAMVVIGVIGYFMRKKAAAQGNQGMQYAGAGAPFGGNAPQREFTPAGGAAAAPVANSAGNIPADFDVDGFVRNARELHSPAGRQRRRQSGRHPRIHLAGNVRRDQDGHRRAQGRQADDRCRPAQRRGARRGGRSRPLHRQRPFQRPDPEEDGAAAQPFAEVWHMAKPRDGSRGWVLAGIQQVQ